MSATALADGWPVRTERRDGERPVGPVEGPVPGEGRFAGERWFYVWNRDALGECSCFRGSVRTTDGGGGAVGVTGSCQRPGKHPWITRVDGELYGFVHGAADAVDWWTLQDLYGPPGGARQVAVVLDDLVVVDIDGERALRDFARMSFTVPKEKILGVSTSPRGFHVWLDLPGWNQKALNLWMSQALASQGGWHGTDPKKAGRRGFMVDVRTGANRFVVWPGGDVLGQRRWIGRQEFGRVLQQALVGMPPWRMAQPPDPKDGGHLPWAVDTSDAWLSAWIAEHRGGAEVDLDGLVFDGTGSEADQMTALDQTWADLERWLTRLERMAEGSGRNNALNQVAYYSGARCVAAGHSVEAVRARLVEVGEAVGTHGVRATVESGLSAGVQAVKAQLSAASAKAEG
jgi:hypothetical protein